MTKDEAMVAMRNGEKLTHCYFTPEEWMTIENGQMLLEDGVRCPVDEFFSFRTDGFWQDGYELYKEKTNENSSDEICTQLVQAFEAANEAMKGFEIQMKKANNAAYKLAITIAINKVMKYLEKVLKSTWITRWYWKRKYKKANLQLEKLILAISTIPDLSFNKNDL